MSTNTKYVRIEYTIRPDVDLDLRRTATMKDTQRKKIRAMTKRISGKREEWLAARLEPLQAMKELTRRSDELARTKDHRCCAVAASGSGRQMIAARNRMAIGRRASSSGASSTLPDG